MTSASLRKEVIDYLKTSKTVLSDEIIIKSYSYQYNTNDVFRSFCDAMSKSPAKVSSQNDLTFLPISVFKQHKVQSGDWVHELAFGSSTTTDSKPSTHLVRSAKWYHNIIESIFSNAYGDPKGYCFLALLPSYLERGNSSLVSMMNYLIGRSKYASSEFYLADLPKLNEQLIYNIEKNIPTILVGVTYALLDLAERFPLHLPKNIILMETGGMKGRREELSKPQVHQILKDAFKCHAIHSEYGMTELLSHFYSQGEGLFDQSHTSASVSLASIQDPQESLNNNQPGRIKIIDLANIDTCSFIMTDDIGILRDSDQFEIVGRMQDAEIRGCNLMYDVIT